MPFIVVYDACVLFPAPLRDLLVRLAMTGMFQAKWSDRILAECFRSILERRPDLTMDQLARTRADERSDPRRDGQRLRGAGDGP